MAEKDLLSEDDNATPEEYVITETPPEEEEQVAEAQAEEEVPEQQAEAEDLDDDERLADSDDPDEDEQPRGRKALTPEEKRAQRQQRKYRRKAAIEHKERELAFLRAENEEFKRRLSSVEKQTTQFSINSVDQKLNEAMNEVQLAERIIAKAIEQGQGEDVTKALAIRDQAIERARQLKAAKEEVEKQPAPQSKKDPRVTAYAKEWIESNNWYDPSGRDEDSAIVKVIDQRLAAEGFNPATEEYWMELDNRVARRLPHRYGEAPVEKTKQASAPAAKRGGPPVGGKREYAAPSTRKEIYINPERKQALIDAGVWDNPELRQKYIKRYADYDRNNSSR